LRNFTSGSFVYVEGKKIVDNDGLDGASSKCGKIQLRGGTSADVVVGLCCLNCVLLSVCFACVFCVWYMYMYTHILIYKYGCIYIYVYMYICMMTRMCIYKYMYVSMYTYIYMYITYICVLITHTYVYIYIHICAYICVHVFNIIVVECGDMLGQCHKYLYL